MLFHVGYFWWHGTTGESLPVIPQLSNKILLVLLFSCAKHVNPLWLCNAFTGHILLAQWATIAK